jgi:Rrf2 family protein
MQNIPKISDAAAIALHTADYLIGQKKPLITAIEITKALNISYNHLSKVLQQLTKAGLVLPSRGPKGGFALTPTGKKARVRDFVTAVDGPLSMKTCLLKPSTCTHRNCIFGDFLSETKRRFEAVLNRRISDLAKRK